MNIIFIIGTAGSGKSELTGAFTNWLQLQGENVIAVNLDPGATIVPYPASVDARDYIQVNTIMENYSLGPNGGLVLACDMLIDIIDKLAFEVDSFGADLVIVDTPGQMELFAFRNTGAKIAEGMVGDSKAIIYLFDSVYCRDPLNYVMNMFIASAINTRFLLPQVSVLSRSDLLKDEELEEILGWSEDAELLEKAIDERLTGTNRMISRDMLDIIYRLGLDFSPGPVSSKSNEGFSWLYSELLRVLTGGEPLTP